MGRVPWRRITSEAFDRALLIAKACCFVHVINNYLVGVAFPRGPSMLPTFNLTGDVVLVDRLSTRWTSVADGHVVLLRSPQNPRKIVAKRVTALQGESVSFVRDPDNATKSETVVVPKGHVWVQGDNINLSKDSRDFGPVPYGLILGRAFMKVWPLKDFGFVQ